MKLFGNFREGFGGAGFGVGGLIPHPHTASDLSEITWLPEASSHVRPYPGAVTVAGLVYCPMKSWKRRLETFLSSYFSIHFISIFPIFHTFSFLNRHQRHNVQVWKKSLNEQKQKQERSKRVPHFKKGDKSDPANYRPISTHVFCAKCWNT